MKLNMTFFSLLAAGMLIATSCSESEYVPVRSEEFAMNSAGVVVPIRDLHVGLADGTVVYPGIEGACDVAHFSGIHYSSDIVSVSYTLKEGSKINPVPPTIKDSAYVVGAGELVKMRVYWAKEQTYIITNADGSTYKMVFKLDDYLAPDPGLSDNPSGLEILFEDNFDNMSTNLPDQDVWKLCTYANNAWSQHFQYVEGWETVRVENGCLKLTAKKEGGHYKNAGIRTKTGFPNNTRVEVKAKLTHLVKGGFPAIWQMPINGKSWPLSGEIDIMEWVQSNPDLIWQTLHRSPAGNGKDVSNSYQPKCNLAEWHTYGVDRTDEAIIFYVDGVETWRFANTGAGELEYPFNKYDYDIILNFSLGGTLNGAMTWPGAITDSDLPGEMWVDWVRVSKL